MDGSGACYLNMPAGGSLRPASHETVDRREHFVRQEGAHVFKYAVRKFVEASQGLLKRNGMSPEQLDLFVDHQANLRIIEAACKRLGMPMDKVFVNVERYGNTGAASVYVAMEEAVAIGRLKRGDLVLMAAFGGGVTWGAALMRY